VKSYLAAAYGMYGAVAIIGISETSMAKYHLA